jgi:hypothetical protein
MADQMPSVLAHQVLAHNDSRCHYGQSATGQVRAVVSDAERLPSPFRLGRLAR